MSKIRIVLVLMIIFSVVSLSYGNESNFLSPESPQVNRIGKLARAALSRGIPGDSTIAGDRSKAIRPPKSKARTSFKARPNFKARPKSKAIYKSMAGKQPNYTAITRSTASRQLMNESFSLNHILHSSHFRKSQHLHDSRPSTYLLSQAKKDSLGVVQYIYFPNSEGTEILYIPSSSSIFVDAMPSWCRTYFTLTSLIICCDPNRFGPERTGSIILKSTDGSDDTNIIVKQAEGNQWDIFEPKDSL